MVSFETKYMNFLKHIIKQKNSLVFAQWKNNKSIKKEVFCLFQSYLFSLPVIPFPFKRVLFVTDDLVARSNMTMCFVSLPSPTHSHGFLDTLLNKKIRHNLPKSMLSQWLGVDRNYYPIFVISLLTTNHSKLI